VVGAVVVAGAVAAGPESTVTVACGAVVAAAGWAVPPAESSVPAKSTSAPVAPITATAAIAAIGQLRRSQGIGEAYGARS
jgi:hypothetical protein